MLANASYYTEIAESRLVPPAVFRPIPEKSDFPDVFKVTDTVVSDVLSDISTLHECRRVNKRSRKIMKCSWVKQIYGKERR